MLAGSALNDASRAFPIDGPGDDVYHGYKMVAGFPGMGGFTEYYGFSGTDWKDAPILENPSEVRTIDGRDYMLFYDGDRLRLVGWKTDKAAYWVINTLTQTLDNDQVISMATGMRELGRVRREGLSREQGRPARREGACPGVWRLRMPLPWPGVPHVQRVRRSPPTAASSSSTPATRGRTECACSRSRSPRSASGSTTSGCSSAPTRHTDHYGLAGPIVDAAGCELWMHPKWEHIRAHGRGSRRDARSQDRGRAPERRPGRRARALREEPARRRAPGVARIVEPDRELVPGVEVETDVGAWQVHETPGHAPSHVTLHEPESGMLISGDHLLGRVSIFFDYGHSPDPVGEFLGGLDDDRGARPRSGSASRATAGRSATSKAKIAANRSRDARERRGDAGRAGERRRDGVRGHVGDARRGR